MDVTFKVESDVFNYRVCAVIVHDGKLLAMHDERSPYFYLPGGRVRVHEPAEEAILREIREELEIDAKIVRPLWLNQGFFTEDVDRKQYHELCLYFLVDVSDTPLLSRGEQFTLPEGKRIHTFEWLDFHRLKSEYLYPLFIKEEIFHLPEHLTLRTEWE